MLRRTINRSDGHLFTKIKKIVAIFGSMLSEASSFYDRVDLRPQRIPRGLKLCNKIIQILQQIRRSQDQSCTEREENQNLVA
jgi:hypothetical protein